ncbi:MAG: glucuronate isomerase [Lentisphaerae bacterium]|nr:glucuronate isomerase [Lentisphaerota bacterium]
MSFLDDSYLLTSGPAREIYSCISMLPIIDAHNHCDVKALSEDRNFTDIWEAEAATDHYVWECLRKCNVPEELITGKNASNQEKWTALAKVFPLIAGNPTYEWVHLDLKRRLGLDLEINAGNAAELWERSCEILARPEMSQQSLIKAMQVEIMCSTDDPADTLEFHQALDNSRIPGVVLPTFRPDKAMNIDKSGWNSYLDTLGKRWNMSIETLPELLEALGKAHDFFASKGCKASDHGVCVPYGYHVDEQTAASVFLKARQGEALSEGEIVAYMSYFLNAVAEMDAEKDWVFQIHIGAVRDVRKSLFNALGPDVGGDISDHRTDIVGPLLPLLNRFDERLKIVLYNLNPIHNATLAQLTRAFGHKVSLGLAWWLCDSYIGMRQQLDFVGTVDVLTNMAGMVSDSRKILSYGSRHEVFRRTLSDSLGAMVVRGQMSLSSGKEIAAFLSYKRPKQLFGF